MSMDYLYIRAWGRLLKSYLYYIQGEVEKAREDNAPEDATFKDSNGTWHRWSEMADSTPNKHTVAAYVEMMKEQTQ